MRTTFRLPDQTLSRLELTLVRRQLRVILEELGSRAGGLELIRRKQVESALRKLDQGEKGKFGICEACARPMLKSRLLEIPYARFCVSCF